jgi:hypothetical protein
LCICVLSEVGVKQPELLTHQQLHPFDPFTIHEWGVPSADLCNSNEYTMAASELGTLRLKRAYWSA